MPYYKAGDYYRAGSPNYAAGGFFGNVLKGIGRVASGVVRTVVGASPIGQVVNALVPPPTTMAQQPLVPVPGIRGFAERVVPGGETGYMVARRRRINPLNIKALRRAMRRAKGFERQARRVGSFFNPGKTFRLKGRKRRAS